ncbi:MAG: PepSY-associated TM helix domain-containing protein [Cyclobacteriaceae bacterium]
MATQVNQKGFELLQEKGRLRYLAAKSYYQYYVRSSLDISEKHPSTSVYLDANTGELLAFDAPTGQKTGNTVSTWLYRLHWADINGSDLPHLIFMALMGIIITVLSLTRVWIWLKKKQHNRTNILAINVIFVINN